MAFDIAKAKQFVQSVDLRGTPRNTSAVAQDPTAEAGTIFDKAKDQAQTVGSGLFSFAKGVTDDVREAISNSALFAQLIANKQASADADLKAWFAAYDAALQNVGWTLQDGGWNNYSTGGTAVEVHEQLLTVLTAALGPAPAALAIITATVNALKAMNTSSPWLTLFDHQSQKAKIARFQIGLVNIDENADVFVTLLMCLIEASSDITQVLFFKFRDARASFEANTSTVSVNRDSMIGLGPAIRAKVLAYQASYVSSIKDL